MAQYSLTESLDILEIKQESQLIDSVSAEGKRLLADKIDLLVPHVKDVIRIGTYIKDMKEVVSSNVWHNAEQSLSDIANDWQKLKATNSPRYIENAPVRIQSIQTKLSSFLVEAAPFIAIKLFLTNEHSPEKFKKVAQDEERQLRSAVKSIIQEADELLNALSDRLTKIETEARKRRNDVVVKTAVEKFELGIKESAKAIYHWQRIAGGVIVLIVAILVWVAIHEPNGAATHQWLPMFTAKVGLIGILSAMLAFSLRMLKAYENLRIILQHKERTIHALPEFVQSMYTMEEGDKLMAEFVRQIADVGNTGLIDGSDNATGPSIMIDALMKGIPKSK